MQIFVPVALFSIILFALVIMKRTYVAQLLGPGIPEPFADLHELRDNINEMLKT